MGVGVVGSTVTIGSLSCASRVLHHREVIHVDRVEASGLVLVGAPCAVAQSIERPPLHVGALNLDRRPADLEFACVELPPPIVGLALLSLYPIPMPFVEASRMVPGDLPAILLPGASAGILGGIQRAMRGVPIPLRPRQLRLGVLVLPASEIEHDGGPEVEGSHRTLQRCERRDSGRVRARRVGWLA